jgi:ATP-dependent DNA helicase RecQ
MATQLDLDGEPVRLAEAAFGYDELRPGQAAALAALGAGRDTLAIMPTGGGKSAIYQLAGLLIPGTTVVVSPLIALQQDQVEAICEAAAADAAQINSTLSDRQREDTFRALEGDRFEYLFLAPEQLAVDSTRDRLKEANVSLFVVDEAHCISEWGHDFRPDYLRLGTVIADLGHPLTLALTATAAPPVRREIVERLGLRDPAVIVQGFDRPNLLLAVERFSDEDAKRDALLDRVLATEKPGIVYTATRRETEELAAALIERGVRAAPYHAGMKASDREATQTAFMEDALDVVVATIAFGMGIDKPNVRFVFHHTISESVDSYYQEIGRAGRDGAPANATLFYLPDDLHLRRFQAGAGQLDADDAIDVLRAVRKRRRPTNIRELKEQTGLADTPLTRALQRLADAGVVSLDADGSVVARHRRVDLEEAAESAVEAQDRHRAMSRTRVEMIRQYADTTGCRRQFILTYFGEAFAPPCDACDNGLAGRTQTVAPAAEPFPVQSRVSHDAWGEGTVLRYEDDKMVVLFDEGGYRTLAVDLVVEEGLLTPIGDPAS